MNQICNSKPSKINGKASVILIFDEHFEGENMSINQSILQFSFLTRENELKYKIDRTINNYKIGKRIAIDSLSFYFTERLKVRHTQLQNKFKLSQF